MMGENTAPIQSADLSGIIERLEKADQPDRGIDAEISAALEPHLFDAPGFTPIRPIPNFRYDPSENIIRFEGGGLMDVRFFPPVTASVDAAIDLAGRVLPGCDISASDIHGDFRQAGEHRHAVDVMADLQWRTYDAYPEPVYSINGSATAPTRALAIVLAVLRALKSKGEA